MDKWKIIIINEKKYLISTYNIKTNWKIMVTNFRELFTEFLTMEQIKIKCQILNPLLSTEDMDINSIATDLLTNLPEYLSNGSSTSQLELRKKIEGGIFKLDIDLQACMDSNEFFEVITRPLCLVIVEINQEKNLIIDEINKKDKEIEEFEINNDLVCRSHMRTNRFDQSKLPVPKSTYQEDLFFNTFIKFFDDNEGLYRKVYIKDDGNMKNDQELIDNKNQPEANNKNEVTLVITPEKNTKATTEIPNNPDESKNEVIKNSEAKKEIKNVHKQPKKSSTNLRSNKRLKKSLSDFIS